ncbi:MAG: 50S ribosomal protein L23 [Oscillospiraceae bacterium]|nr:50S ribosomal protein L23 [Oscillospiraceae bacterium]MDD3832543.1 50S ribosomal protein L23 [Oscillospiraceae bacterium]MDD4545762.1 50S ribosomal protein L23 [Oscillospiraceae bacterium]
MDPRDIILAPVVTEKSVGVLSENKYTFRVVKSANKIQIAKAVEEIFGVKVAKVNTISMKGHLRRQGRSEGYTASWKKAVVTLTHDSKTIEFFDGMF